MRAIDEMKQILGLQNVKIMYSDVPNAEAQLIDGEPYILLSHDIPVSGVPLLFVVGHEMGHIISGDLIKGRSKIQYLMYGILMVTLLIYIFLIHMFSLNWWLIVLLLLILLFDFYVSHVFDNAMGNYFYQEQIKELRADRIGFQISEASIDDVKEVARVLPDYSEGYHSPSLIDRIFIRFRIMPKPDDLHPFWEIRIKELKEHGKEKWSIKDDIRYTWRFTFGLIFGNDWRI